MNLISKECVNFVKKFEGFYPTPYYDIVGVKTLGYGMTGKEIEGLVNITEAEATTMLENLLNKNYAAPLKKDLDNKGVKLNQNEFDALVSMAYNVGVAGLMGSTLYRNVCAGVKNTDTITKNFEAWSYAGGKQIYGLLRRRREEAKMFLKEGVKKVKYLIIYNNIVDQRAAEYLADKLNCPTIWGARNFDFSCVENVIGVGGTKEQYTQYLTKLISGSNRYETMQNVLKSDI